MFSISLDVIVIALSIFMLCRILQKPEARKAVDEWGVYVCMLALGLEMCFLGSDIKPFTWLVSVVLSLGGILILGVWFYYISFEVLKAGHD